MLNVLFVMISLALMSIGQWLLMSFVSRVSGVAMLGDLAFSLNVISPVIAFCSLGMRWLIVTEEAYSHQIAVLFVSRLLITLCVSSPIVFGIWWSSANTAIITIIIPVLFAKIAEGLCDISYGKYNRNNLFLYQLISIILRVSSAGICFIITFHIYRSVPISLLSISASWLFVFIFYDLKKTQVRAMSLWRNTEKAINYIPTAVRHGWPLSVSSGIGAVGLAVPTYSLMYYSGSEDVGYYAALFSFVVVLNIVAIAIGQASLSALSACRVNMKRRKFVLICTTLSLAILSTVGLVSIIFSQWSTEILYILFGIEDEGVATSLPTFIRLSSLLVVGQFLNYSLTATASYKYLVVSPSVALVVSTVSSLIFIPGAGYVGAMYVLFSIGFTNILIISYLIRRALWLPHT